MNEKLMDCIGNPVMLRLLFEIQRQEQATAKMLAGTYKDIPQATLYRYLGRMLDDGILKVVQENKIRGTVEKVYALGVALEISEKDMKKKNAADEYLRVFTQYQMGLLREFQEYTSRKDIDILTDGSGFWLTPVYMTKGELKTVAAEMQALLKPLLENKPEGKRKLRNIGVVITPPREV